MEWITLVTNWFAENESVLSGIAAFVAIVGLLLSPLGGHFKALLTRNKSNEGSGRQQDEPPSSPAKPAIESLASATDKPTVYIEPFTGSSEAASTFALELYQDVQRAVTNLTGSILVTDPARADYIARANVLLTGSRCRATGRLQHRHSTEDFASERYEADIDDRLEAIDQLSAKLSTAIRYGIALHLTNQQGDNTQTILLNMARGMIGPDSELFQQSLAIAEQHREQLCDDSMFQAIYARLLWGITRFDYRPVASEQLQEAERIARRAVTLNDRSDFAHFCLGSLLLYMKGDFAGARRSFSRSLEITPRYHMGEAGLAEVEVFSGDTRQGIDLCKRERQHPAYKNGRFHEAAAAGELKLGNYAAAVDLAEDAIHSFGKTTQTLIVLAAAAGLAGEDQIAAQAANSLKEKHPDINIAEMRRWPYKDDADWELFVSGLRKAGLE